MFENSPAIPPPLVNNEAPSATPIADLTPAALALAADIAASPIFVFVSSSVTVIKANIALLSPNSTFPISPTVPPNIDITPVAAERANDRDISLALNVFAPCSAPPAIPPGINTGLTPCLALLVSQPFRAAADLDDVVADPAPRASL